MTLESIGPNGSPINWVLMGHNFSFGPIEPILQNLHTVPFVGPGLDFLFNTDLGHIVDGGALLTVGILGLTRIMTRPSGRIGLK